MLTSCGFWVRLGLRDAWQYLRERRSKKNRESSPETAYA